MFKHEFVHVEQAERYGWIKFFFISLWGKFNYKNPDIDQPFEVEAYRRQYEALTPLEESILSTDRNRELSRNFKKSTKGG